MRRSTQFLISAFGWVARDADARRLGAADPALRAAAGEPVPAAPTPPGTASAPASTPASIGLREQLRIAVRDRSYWLLHAGFFTCGFHVAFLVTHLPGEVALCGLPASVAATSIAFIGLFNIAGSLTAGALGNRYRMKWLLYWIYFARAVAVALYLLAPKTATDLLRVRGGLGFTYLSTVPPTAGLIGKLFGVRYLATLFGLTLLSHQIGGFFGAWLGGIAIDRTGSYQWMWYADIALALFAAFINLPIREARLPARVQPA